MLELPEQISLNQEDIEVRLFEADDLIVRPGDADDCAYVVLDGKQYPLCRVMHHLRIIDGLHFGKS